MPELPDVEVFRRYLQRHGLHRRIAAVDASGGEALLEEVTPASLADALEGRELTGTGRHGKYLFAAISGDGGALVLHFGMTGFLAAYDSGEPPRHTRLRLDFADGGHLAYSDMRKLGRVALADSAQAYAAAKELGPDALDDVADAGALGGLLQGRTAGLKSTLMNQEVLAGIGNDYSDEICFQARLDPRTPVNRLSAAQVRAVFDAMRRVLREAIAAEADPQRMPDDFLLPFRSPGEACPRCGGEIRKIKVSGRSGYWCPRCQGG